VGSSEGKLSDPSQVRSRACDPAFTDGSPHGTRCIRPARGRRIRRPL